MSSATVSGMGPIYMNEVKCLGQERSIWNCPFKNITSEDCQHTEDAAVRCNIPYVGLETSVRDCSLMHVCCLLSVMCARHSAALVVPRLPTNI